MHYQPVPYMVYHNLYRGQTIIPRKSTAQSVLSITAGKSNTAQLSLNVTGSGKSTAQSVLNIFAGYERSHQTQYIIREVLRVTN